jgi:hypothetical protein
VARQLACLDGWDAVARDPGSGLILSLAARRWAGSALAFERNSFLGIGEGQDGKTRGYFRNCCHRASNHRALIFAYGKTHGEFRLLFTVGNLVTALEHAYVHTVEVVALDSKDKTQTAYSFLIAVFSTKTNRCYFCVTSPQVNNVSPAHVLNFFLTGRTMQRNVRTPLLSGSVYPRKSASI